MEEFITHIASPGESWGWVALRYYSDESQMERVMRANPEMVSIVFFDGGEQVRVPVISDTELAVSSSSIPPWRR